MWKLLRRQATNDAAVSGVISLQGIGVVAGGVCFLFQVLPHGIKKGHERGARLGAVTYVSKNKIFTEQGRSYFVVWIVVMDRYARCVFGVFIYCRFGTLGVVR